MARQVFVACAHDDQVSAEAVVADLEGAGISCWIAPRDIAIGEYFASAILKAVANSQVIVVVVSPAAISSPQVANEVRVAFERHKQIIAFHLEDAELSSTFGFLLGPAPSIDARTGPLVAAIGRLRAAIEMALTEETGRKEEMPSLEAQRKLLTPDSPPHAPTISRGPKGEARYDAFLSYARVDNEPVAAGADGDVSKFHTAVERQMRQRWRRDARIFIDLHIQSGQRWRRVLEEHLNAVNFMIVMLSPSFFESEECRAEVAMFAALAAKAGLEPQIFPVLIEDVGHVPPDEFYREIMARQYANYTKLKFKRPEEEPFREFIAEFAGQIHVALAKRTNQEAAVPEVEVTAPPPVIVNRRCSEREARDGFNIILDIDGEPACVIVPPGVTDGEEIWQKVSLPSGSRRAVRVDIAISRDRATGQREGNPDAPTFDDDDRMTRILKRAPTSSSTPATAAFAQAPAGTGSPPAESRLSPPTRNSSERLKHERPRISPRYWIAVVPALLLVGLIGVIGHGLIVHDPANSAKTNAGPPPNSDRKAPGNPGRAPVDLSLRLQKGDSFYVESKTTLSIGGHQAASIDLTGNYLLSSVTGAPPGEKCEWSIQLIALSPVSQSGSNMLIGAERFPIPHATDSTVWPNPSWKGLWWAIPPVTMNQFPAVLQQPHDKVPVMDWVPPLSWRVEAMSRDFARIDFGGWPEDNRCLLHDDFRRSLAQRQINVPYMGWHIDQIVCRVEKSTGLPVEWIAEETHGKDMIVRNVVTMVRR